MCYVFLSQLAAMFFSFNSYTAWWKEHMASQKEAEHHGMPAHDAAKTHPEHHFNCMWHNRKVNQPLFWYTIIWVCNYPNAFKWILKQNYKFFEFFSISSLRKLFYCKLTTDFRFWKNHVLTEFLTEQYYWKYLRQRGLSQKLGCFVWIFFLQFPLSQFTTDKSMSAMLI